MNGTMKLVKKIREAAGLSRYAMAYALWRSWDAYNYLEDRGKVLSVLDVVELQKLSGLTLEKFWELLVEEAESQKKGRKRTKGKPSKLRERAQERKD